MRPQDHGPGRPRKSRTRPVSVGRRFAALGRVRAVAANAVAAQALRWPLFMPLFFAFGAAAYFEAPSEPAWELLAVAAIAPLSAWLVLRRWPAAAFVCLLLLCAGAGAFCGKARTLLVAQPVLSHKTQAVRVEGVVLEIDAGAKWRRVRLEVRSIEGLAPGQTPRRVRITHRAPVEVGPGRTVSCRAILSPPPRPSAPGDYAFHRDAWFQQLGAVGFALGPCRPIAAAPPTDLAARALFAIQAARRAIAERVVEAAGQGGGPMAAAMTAGDRSFISPEDAESLRASGLAHLLSISGVHMVLVGGAAFFIIRLLWPLIEPLALRAPTVRVAAGGALLACSAYYLLSGGEVATQRSYIMAAVGFGAKLLDRPALSLRSVAVALAVTTALQPESVVMPGFQMSFAASAAIIALYDVWPHLGSGRGVIGKARGWLVGATATSLTASLATLPASLHHFNRTAAMSIPANLLVSPIISLITTPAAMAAAAAAPFGFDGPFLDVTGRSLEAVMAISYWAQGAAPEPRLPHFGVAAFVFAMGGVILFCVFRGAGKLAAAPFAACAAAFWMLGGQTVGYVAADASVYIKTADNWVRLASRRTERGLRPLAVPADFGEDPCIGRFECRIAARAGAFEQIEPETNQPNNPQPVGARPPPDPRRRCGSEARLLFRPTNGAALELDPCEIAKQGGGVIEIFGGRARIRLGRLDLDRPWSNALALVPSDNPEDDAPRRRGRRPARSAEAYATAPAVTKDLDPQP